MGRGKLIISFRPINLKNNLTTFLVLRLQAKIDHLLLQHLTVGILALEKLSVSGVEKSEHHSVLDLRRVCLLSNFESHKNY